MSTLVNRIQEVLTRCPDGEALVMIDHAGERSFTYREFLGDAAARAQAFRAEGLKAGDLVILVQEQGEALLAGFWGALLLGAIPSIFPFLSDKLDPARYFSSVRQLVERSGAVMVVADARFRPELEQALDGLPTRIVTSGPASWVEPEPLLAQATASADGTAFLQHSSGSTGLQKGVMLSHTGVIGQVEAYSRALDLTSADVVISWLPLYHDMGLIAGFILPLVQGCKLVLMSPFHWVRDPQIVLHAITRHRGTLCWQPNFAYSFLALRIRDSALEGVDLSSLRAAINCSEPVSAESHRQFLKRFEPYGLRPEALTTCYAMAENTFAVTQSALNALPPVDRIDAEAFASERRALPAVEGRRSVEVVSCGQPIDGVDIRIVDEQRQPLPERQIGEIVLRSPFMLTGYYHQPDLSAAALSDGWFLTGDLGYVAEGELYVTGRKKDLIIVGGRNIYPQDIETLVNGVDGVHAGRSVAFGLLNDRAGTEDIIVIAEVTTDEPDARIAIERAIRASVTQTLDVTVRQVRLVGANWLVKTSSGKIARAANRTKFLEDPA